MLVLHRTAHFRLLLRCRIGGVFKQRRQHVDERCPCGSGRKPPQVRSWSARPPDFHLLSRHASQYETAAADAQCPPVASRPLGPQAPPPLHRLPTLFGAATGAARGAGDNRAASRQPGRHGGQGVCGGERARRRRLARSDCTLQLQPRCCLRCSHAMYSSVASAENLATDLTSAHRCAHH